MLVQCWSARKSRYVGQSSLADASGGFTNPAAVPRSMTAIRRPLLSVGFRMQKRAAFGRRSSCTGTVTSALFLSSATEALLFFLVFYSVTLFRVRRRVLNVCADQQMITGPVSAKDVRARKRQVSIKVVAPRVRSTQSHTCWAAPNRPESCTRDRRGTARRLPLWTAPWLCSCPKYLTRALSFPRRRRCSPAHPESQK
eukprot:scaffold495_cov243-Pinguiococcus_pyrenoidosus.AAC.23